MCEFSPEKNQNMMGTLWNCSEGSIYIYLIIYYKFISKTWVWTVVFGTALNVLILVIHPFVPESPKYLLDKNRYGECYQVLKKMASFNRVDYTP